MGFFEGTIAVVGASEKRIAAQIFATLHKQYSDVIPVNPKCVSVLGVTCVPSIELIIRPIDTVVMVVNPSIGKNVLDQIIEMGIKKVWFQPGAGSDELRDICEKNKLEYSFDICLMHI